MTDPNNNHNRNVVNNGRTLYWPNTAAENYHHVAVHPPPAAIPAARAPNYNAYRHPPAAAAAKEAVATTEWSDEEGVKEDNRGADDDDDSTQASAEEDAEQDKPQHEKETPAAASTTTTPTSDKKPKAKNKNRKIIQRLYYAVRPTPYFTAPVIFFTLKDLQSSVKGIRESRGITKKKAEELPPLLYKKFEHLADALDYINRKDPSVIPRKTPRHDDDEDVPLTIKRELQRQVQRQDQFDQMFEKRLAALKAYKEEFGNLDPPGKTHKTLQRFISDMRKRYRESQQKQQPQQQKEQQEKDDGDKDDTTTTPSKTISTEPRLSLTHVHKLQDLGLSLLPRDKYIKEKAELAAQQQAQAKQEAFNRRFDEHMEEFKKHKDVRNIPFGSELWKFVSELRRLYQDVNHGRASPLTAKHIVAMNALGIDISIKEGAPMTPEARMKWKQERFNKNFSEKIKDLKEFKEKFGHVNPPCGTNLYQWICRMRQQYNALKMGLYTPGGMKMEHSVPLLELGVSLTPKRVLAASQFKLQAKGSRKGAGLGKGRPSEEFKRIRYNKMFEEKVEEIKAFKEEHGEDAFPITSSHRNWVARQRQHYKNFQNGDPTPMTSMHVTVLRDLGVSLVVVPTTTTLQANTVRKKHSLETIVNGYLAFVKEHGREPAETATDELELRLCRAAILWRRKRKLARNGVAHHHKLGNCELPEEVIAKLDEMKFDWNAKGGGPNRPPQLPWERRFEQLKQYKERFGHTEVPKRYPTLGDWCLKQRQNYKAMLENKKSPMSMDRFRKLSQLGFRFKMGREGRPCTRYVDDRGWNEEDDVEVKIRLKNPTIWENERRRLGRRPTADDVDVDKIPRNKPGPKPKKKEGDDAPRPKKKRGRPKKDTDAAEGDEPRPKKKRGPKPKKKKESTESSDPSSKNPEDRQSEEDAPSNDSRRKRPNKDSNNSTEGASANNSNDSDGATTKKKKAPTQTTETTNAPPNHSGNVGAYNYGYMQNNYGRGMQWYPRRYPHGYPQSYPHTYPQSYPQGYPQRYPIVPPKPKMASMWMSQGHSPNRSPVPTYGQKAKVTDRNASENAETPQKTSQDQPPTTNNTAGTASPEQANTTDDAAGKQSSASNDATADQANTADDAEGKLPSTIKDPTAAPKNDAEEDKPEATSNGSDEPASSSQANTADDGHDALPSAVKDANGSDDKKDEPRPSDSGRASDNAENAEKANEDQPSATNNDTKTTPNGSDDLGSASEQANAVDDGNGTLPSTGKDSTAGHANSEDDANDKLPSTDTDPTASSNNADEADEPDDTHMTI